MECDVCSARFIELVERAPALAQAWAALPRVTLAKGETLLRAGEAARSVWQVQGGLLRMYYLSADGLERNRSFHDEGHWLGAGVPPGEVISPFTIEAIEPSQLVALPYAQLRHWQDARSEVRSWVQQALTAVFARLAQREEQLLLLDATQRYLSFQAQYATMAPRIPLHHVASYLGITNVALSRIRRRLARPQPGEQPL